MILLTGKSGQLGWELRRALAPFGELTACDAEELPLVDPAAIRRAIRKLRPTLVVNAAALSDLDRAEEQVDLALAINGVAPAIIAEEVKRQGGGIVHFSSGCVFDGTKKGAYDEGDPPRPANVFGETRLAGEAGVRGVGAPHLILRTGWLYGGRGRSFLRTTLEAASGGVPLRAINDQRGAPTWCRMVAEATALVLARTGAARRPESLEDYGGTYHLTAAGEASWYEFARAILARAPRPLRALAAQVEPVATRDLAMKARRPANARLDCTKFTETFGFTLPDWRESLELVMEDLGAEWRFGSAPLAARGASPAAVREAQGCVL